MAHHGSHDASTDGTAGEPHDPEIAGEPRLHAVEWRREQAATVLLLHGANQHARYWDRLAGLLTDYRVVALDARGHGRSAWSEGGEYGAEHYVADLVRTVDAMLDGHDERLALVGHSTGALISMIYASRHADRLWAAAFIDIDPQPPPSQRERLRDAGGRPPRTFASLDEVRERIERVTPGLPAESYVTLAEATFVRAQNGAYEQRMDPQTLAQFPQFDNRSLLTRIDAPTLVLRGEESTVSSLEAAEAAAAALPRGTLAVVTREHQLYVQRPEELAAVLIPFLQRNAPGG